MDWDSLENDIEQPDNSSKINWEELDKQTQEESPKITTTSQYLKNALYGIPGRFEEAAAGIAGPFAPQSWLDKVARQREWMNTHPGSGIGEAIADVGLSIPATVFMPQTAATGPIGKALEMIAQQAVTSGMQAYATTPGGQEERNNAAALGAGGAAIFGTLGQGTKGILKGGGNIIRKIFPDKEAEKYAMSALLKEAIQQEDIPTVIKNLEAAPKLIKGYMPTSAEVGDDFGLNALQKFAEGINPGEYGERNAYNMLMRYKALEKISKKPIDVLNAEVKRESIAGPWYKYADTKPAFVDKEMSRMLKTNPAMKSAFMHAVELSAIKNKPVSPAVIDSVMNARDGAAISGEGIHLIKIGLDAKIKNAKNAMQEADMEALETAKKHFENWRERQIPVYNAAQKLYRRFSIPINRMKTGEAIKNSLYPNANKYGDVQFETPNKFYNAIQPNAKTAEKATGFKGAKLENQLTKRQIRQIENVAKNLKRYQQSKEGAGGAFTQDAPGMIARLPGAIAGGVGGIPGAYQLGAAQIFEKMAKSSKNVKRGLASSLLEPSETAMLLKLGERDPVLKILDGLYRNKIPGVMGYAISQRLRGE